MTRPILIACLLCLCPRFADADGRINGKVDFNWTSVAGDNSDVGLKWQGIEVEFENEFKSNPVLSGFAIGVRRELFYAFTGFGGQKDVDRWDEGTYLFVRFFKGFDISGDRQWSLGPQFSLLYGVPGTTLDRTIVSRYGDGASSTHVFPVRNATVPQFAAAQTGLAADAALFYPEVSVALRRRFAKGGICIDWTGGVRIMQFGVTDSGPQGNAFNQRRVFIPLIGLRVGFRVF